MTPCLCSQRGGADLSIFSEDCLHFSEHGHAELAIALWNNMVSAWGSRGLVCVTLDADSLSHKEKPTGPCGSFLPKAQNRQLIYLS